MPVSTLYLDGEPEPFAETVRHWLAINWPANASIAPVIMSSHGENTNPATKQALAQVNFDGAKSINSIIVMNDGKGKPIQNGNGITTHRYISYVEITIYGDTPANIDAMSRIVDEILLEHYANTTVRVNKSDGKTSAIMTFDTDSLDWSPPVTYKDAGIDVMTVATLGCVWQQSIS